MVLLWVAFFVLVFVLLALDLGVLNRRPHEVRLREALAWSALWISVGLLFAVAVYFIYGGHWGGEEMREALRAREPNGRVAVLAYLTAYVLEKSLSIDNIFVMSVIFLAFRIPNRFQHRVLFWGILGAIVFRLAFIFGGVWLVHRFGWIFYIFGAYLVYAGGKMLFFHEADPDPERAWYMRLARRVLPLAKEDHGKHFMAREGGRIVFTRLAVTLLAIELTDIVFAVDSIPAVLAISTDEFVIVTSNVFAILGLRSLYFVLADMIRRFRFLTPAIAVVLVLIGVKLLLHEYVDIPNEYSLGAVFGTIAIGVIASVFDRRRNGEPPAGE